MMTEPMDDWKRKSLRFFTVVAIIVAVAFFISACGNETSSTPLTTTQTSITTSPAKPNTPTQTSSTTTLSTVSEIPTPESVDISSMTLLSVLTGSVSVQKSGGTEWMKIERGTELGPGDVIKTGNESSAKILLFDGSILEIDQGTTIVIMELDLHNTGTTTIRIRQEIGKTVSRVQKLADTRSRYEIETPSAIAAVRGSTMIVDVLEDTTTTVTNVSGDIWIIAQGIEKLIPEGMQSTAALGQAPGQPEPTPIPTPPSTWIPVPTDPGHPHFD